MSDQAAQPDPGSEPEQGTQPEQSGPPEWLAPIEQRMNELRDQNLALVNQIQSWQQPETSEEEFEDVSIEDLLGDDGELTPEAAQALIDDRVAEAVREQLGVRDAEEALVQRDDVWNDLLERIPALEDPAVSAPLVNAIAEELNQTGYGAIVDTPLFVDLIEREYKAMKFDERMASEQPQQRQVVLESGQGAAPQQQPEEDWGERIVKAAERLRPKI